MSNEQAVLCHDCQHEIEPLMGHKVSNWSEDYVCGTCQDARTEASERRKVREQAQGAILLQLLPTLGKLGAVVKFTGGESAWTSDVRLEVGGRTFEISVRAEED